MPRAKICCLMRRFSANCLRGFDLASRLVVSVLFIHSPSTVCINHLRKEKNKSSNESPREGQADFPTKKNKHGGLLR